MEVLLEKQILSLCKDFNYTSEEATKEVLRQPVGRQAMQDACAMFNITPKDYVQYLSGTVERTLKKEESKSEEKH